MHADDARAQAFERHTRAYERHRDAQERAIAAGERFNEDLREVRLSIEASTGRAQAEARAFRRRVDDRLDG